MKRQDIEHVVQQLLQDHQGDFRAAFYDLAHRFVPSCMAPRPASFGGLLTILPGMPRQLLSPSMMDRGSRRRWEMRERLPNILCGKRADANRLCSRRLR